MNLERSYVDLRSFPQLDIVATVQCRRQRQSTVIGQGLARSPALHDTTSYYHTSFRLRSRDYHTSIWHRNELSASSAILLSDRFRQAANHGFPAASVCPPQLEPPQFQNTHKREETYD